MKLGNTSFNPEAIKGMTFAEFRSRLAGKLDGVDIRQAFQTITGRMPEADEPKKRERKVTKLIEQKNESLP